jgi:PAS domain S-box-containing protein
MSRMSKPISSPDLPQPAFAVPDKAWFELAVWASRMGTFDWDLVTDTLYVSEQNAQMFGSTRGLSALDRPDQVYQLIHPDDLEKVRAAVDEGVRVGRPYKIEHRIIRPRDGRVAWVMTAGTPLADASGKIVRIIGISQDSTELKAAETQRETLVAELDHRVKNVLASVQSLALQSARKAPSIDTFLKTFSGRLKAMATAHTLLTATRWRGAAIPQIINAELGGLAPGQTRWEGPEMLLTPRATNALALALHELATNAVKFGALSTDLGMVYVDWRQNDEGGFSLVWTESGGPLVTTPPREGFGATLLNKVTGRELGGEVKIDFLATGVRATLTSDASALAAPGVDELIAAPAPEPTVAGASRGDDTPRHAAKVDGMRILIVEDSLLLSLELESGLVEAGAVVVGQATDVAEGLVMAALPMDAAVLDANLNGESVAPVARALEARGIPFIFATGYGDNISAPQGFSAPFIRKPYDVTQVAAALAEVTGRA